MGRQLVQSLMTAVSGAVIIAPLAGAAWADSLVEAAPMADPASEPVTTVDEISPSAAPAPVQPPPPVVQRRAGGEGDGMAEARHGWTLDLELGTGWLSADGYGGTGDRAALLLNGSVAAGKWLSPKLAVTGRVLAVAGEDEEAALINLMLGPHAQYWFGEHLWGGAGLGVVAASMGLHRDDGEFGILYPPPELGLGVDLRLGYSLFADPRAAFHVAVEATTWLINEHSVLTMALMAGFQML